ncbi:MAG: hypothetical protein Q8O67_14460 [Deltaproteobacteria bacterium]|nr:hypothetical protein [Deltaproteobacteria bacterium]
MNKLPLRFSLLGLVGFVLLGAPALAAPAAPLELHCTLRKPVKISEAGVWRVLAKATPIVITARSPTWTNVVVDGKPGRAASTLLDQACDLPPAAPDLAPLAPIKPVPPVKPKTPIVKLPTPKVPAPPKVLPGKATAPPTTTTTLDSVPEPPPAEVPVEPIIPITPPAVVPVTPPIEIAPPPPATTTTRPLRIAVQRIEGSPDDERLLRVATDAMVVELRKLQKVSVIGFDEVQALLDLEAQKQLAGCDTGSCISDIADALGADALITGAIARVDTSVVIGFKRLDPHEGRAVAVFTRRLDDQHGEECLAAIGPAVAELFVDVPLRPGLTRGVDPQEGLRLNPPPLPVWAFATSAATTGVALATTGVALAVFVGASGNANSLIERSTKEDVVAADLTGQINVAETSFGAAAAAGAITTAFAATTVVLGLFTDWQGHQDQ